jgi:hypothetical protein
MCFNAYVLYLTADSWASQRPKFPATGKALLAFWLYTNCNKFQTDDVFEVRVDSVLQFRVDQVACLLYSSNWTWISLDIGRFADGEEHEISFSSHIGPGSIPSLYLVDAVRFVSTEAADPLYEALAGPCNDRSSPLLLHTDGAVCPFFNISCCATPEKTAAVQSSIDAITSTGCKMI